MSFHVPMNINVKMKDFVSKVPCWFYLSNLENEFQCTHELKSENGALSFKVPCWFYVLSLENEFPYTHLYKSENKGFFSKCLVGFYIPDLENELTWTHECLKKKKGFNWNMYPHTFSRCPERFSTPRVLGAGWPDQGLFHLPAGV